MTEQRNPAHPIKEPSFADALAPLLVLAALIAAAVALFGLGASEGPLQVALILSAMVTAGILLKNGHTWEAIAAAGQREIAPQIAALAT